MDFPRRSMPWALGASIALHAVALLAILSQDRQPTGFQGPQDQGRFSVYLASPNPEPEERMPSSKPSIGKASSVDGREPKPLALPYPADRLPVEKPPVSTPLDESSMGGFGARHEPSAPKPSAEQQARQRQMARLAAENSVDGVGKSGSRAPSAVDLLIPESPSILDGYLFETALIGQVEVGADGAAKNALVIQKPGDPPLPADFLAMMELILKSTKYLPGESGGLLVGGTFAIQIDVGKLGVVLKPQRWQSPGEQVDPDPDFSNFGPAQR